MPRRPVPVLNVCICLRDVSRSVTSGIFLWSEPAQGVAPCYFETVFGGQSPEAPVSGTSSLAASLIGLLWHGRALPGFLFPLARSASKLAHVASDARAPTELGLNMCAE